MYTCFLHMSKALERVNPMFLLHKLSKSKVPSNLIKTLEYALHKTRASVEFKGGRSRTWLLRKGLQQGEVLSAYLFCISFGALENTSSEDYGCRIGVDWRKKQAYADDVAIFCPRAAGLLNLLINFVEQCEQRELVLNYDKTKILKFSRQDESIFTGKGR